MDGADPQTHAAETADPLPEAAREAPAGGKSHDDRIADAIAGLSEHKTTETLDLYLDGLSAEITDDKRFADAAIGKLAELKRTQKPEPGRTPIGTPRIRKDFLRRIAAASGLDVLDLIIDETRGFEWTDPARAELNDAYRARKQELTKGSN
jgi:hypothetical protein